MWEWLLNQGGQNEIGDFDGFFDLSTFLRDQLWGQMLTLC